MAKVLIEEDYLLIMAEFMADILQKKPGNKYTKERETVREVVRMLAEVNDQRDQMREIARRRVAEQEKELTPNQRAKQVRKEALMAFIERNKGRKIFLHELIEVSGVGNYQTLHRYLDELERSGRLDPAILKRPKRTR